jgi:hypothetical protein
MAPAMSLPLAGVRVLDLANVLAGPFCGRHLATERPGMIELPCRGGTMPVRPWDKTSKEVTMENRNTAPGDDRLAARKVILEELTRLRDQFSSGWFNIDQNAALAALQAPRFIGVLVRTARPPGSRK